jgi:carbon starvation protein
LNAIVILLVGAVILLIGYVFYGSWLAKQWGVDENKPTPAHELEDGKDYVPAKAPVLMGHHFSSIAGAGPINGPVQAAIFGWVPVLLWILIGGIFFGAVHDFGSLFASIRHKGESIGEVIRQNIGRRAHKLFIVFALLVLILVVASFTNVVAGTFASTADSLITTGADVSNTAATATTSLLFIVLAIFFGFAVYRRNAPLSVSTIAGIVGIILITIIGLNVGINISRTGWIIFIAVYITVASLVPVWILLQPRDYLSSFLLYAMIIAAIVGVFGSHPTMELPAFTSFNVNGSYLFPTLFITVACGACSGFHSLVGSGTTSKQLNSEKDAKAIGYGSMIIECVLAILALIAVGIVWSRVQAGELTVSSPAVVFSTGIATMLQAVGGGNETVYNTAYTLITLAVSVFALTSLDTATRLARYMFTELFLKDGETIDQVTGFRKVLAHPLTGTLFMVIIGCSIGALQLSQIWGLFGAANQLLAGVALMAVAAWLGNIGKNNKMFYIPMTFMLVVTLTSLCLTVKAKIAAFIAGAEGAFQWGNWFQLIFAVALIVLAIILIVQGVQTLIKKKPAED